MTPDETDAILDQTLEDRRLSRAEKRALGQIVRSMATDLDQRAVLQHRALAVASHRDDCAGKIVGLLSRARRSVDICVFTITDDRIAKAIVEAHECGIALRIITDDDKFEEPGSDIARFREAGNDVRIDDSPHHMHHKFAVFDERVLLNGSYNWTRGAARDNEEIFLVTDDGRLVAVYATELPKLWERYGSG